MKRITLLRSMFALVLLALLPSMTTAATETITWIHTDHLGSPIAGRNDAGETTWEQAYAPWGEKQAVAGVPQAPAGVGYTGHVYDEQVGLVYAGARWYDPAMGRFISPDAVRFNLASSSSFNRYAYSNNSAFMFTDPDGHLADLVVDIGFIGYSIYTFAAEPTWTNGLALGADVAGAMIPFATGLGAAVRAGKQADGAIAGVRETTVLGENMMERVIPYADNTGARTLPFGTTPEKWAELTPKERWKLNDGALRKRINEGDSFIYIGQDAYRDPALRRQFDLTGSELLRLNERGIKYDTVSPSSVKDVIGRQ